MDNTPKQNQGQTPNKVIPPECSLIPYSYYMILICQYGSSDDANLLFEAVLIPEDVFFDDLVILPFDQ